MQISVHIHCNVIQLKVYAGISLGMHPSNERRRYNVTTSLIGLIYEFEVALI